MLQGDRTITAQAPAAPPAPGGEPDGDRTTAPPPATPSSEPARLDALEDENARLRKTLAVVKGGLADLETSAAALRLDMAGLVAALNRETAARQAAEADVLALRERLAQAQAARGDDQRQALAALNERLAQADRRVAALTEQRDRLASRQRQVQASCAAPAIPAATADVLAGLNDRLGALQAERDALHARNAEVTEATETCIARLSGYDRRFAAALREIERLEAARQPR
jgi:chromosome segregation ATPase